MRYFLLIIFLPNFLFSQAPAIEWEKHFGGSIFDGGSAIVSTYNSYVVCGYSNSSDFDLTSNYGGSDAVLFKLDNSGALQWQKNYGGTYGDYFLYMKATFDGGFIVGGATFSNDGDVSGNHGEEDFWVVKMDSLGNIQWQKCFGGSNDDELVSVQPTNDNGYIVSGVTRSFDGDVIGHHAVAIGIGDDYWVVKLDSLGNIQWQKCFGGSQDDYAYEVKQTTDRGYIVTGVTSSPDGEVTHNHYPSRDCWVVKLDSLGSIQWQNTYGGSSDEIGNSITQTFDGGFIVSGNSNSSDGNLTGNYGSKDFWILKIDSMGVLQWQKNYGGVFNELGFSVLQNVDSTYTVLGYTSSIGDDIASNYGGTDIWLINISQSGILNWEKNLGGTLDDNASYGITPTLDGFYAIVGSSQSNNLDVSGNYGDSDCWVVKLGMSTEIDLLQSNMFTEIYPNPVEDLMTINTDFNTSINIEITNMLGQIIFTKQILNQNDQNIDVASLTSGIYSLRVTNGRNVKVEKFVKK